MPRRLNFLGWLPRRCPIVIWLGKKGRGTLWHAGSRTLTAFSRSVPPANDC